MSKTVAVREKTNDGLSGAPKRKIGSPGQNSDGGSKNSLESQLGSQVDNYHAKGSDFPVKAISAATGQDGGAAGSSEGKDALATLSGHQESPRSVEDGDAEGSGGPSGWSEGSRSSRIAAAFPIEASKGESNEAGGETPVKVYVDLESGQFCVDGYEQTRLKETPKAYGQIPAR